ncbi:hypothetical protein Rsph17029_3215 [Rhodobacter sphaeroides ATCC 17029]|nr:hypothetical protein Rsph17029_3215 [Cereibacter sphaeroides ATCC 17029]
MPVSVPFPLNRVQSTDRIHPEPEQLPGEAAGSPARACATPPAGDDGSKRSLMIDVPTDGRLRVELGAPQCLGHENLDALLPYDGTRGVVHRSACAKTGMLVARTEEDKFLPRAVGHESGLERATAISALIHPNTYGLKCQPRKVIFEKPIADIRSNTLDYLLTLRTGQKIYLFVKNLDSVRRAKTALICEAIRRGLPEGHGFAVISEASFPQYTRGNNERIFLAKRFPDPDADDRLAEVLAGLIDSPKFTIEELVFRCGLGPRAADHGRAFNAILRAIGDGKLAANRRELIHYPTVVEHLG